MNFRNYHHHHVLFDLNEHFLAFEIKYFQLITTETSVSIRIITKSRWSIVTTSPCVRSCCCCWRWRFYTKISINFTLNDHLLPSLFDSVFGFPRPRPARRFSIFFGSYKQNMQIFETIFDIQTSTFIELASLVSHDSSLMFRERETNILLSRINQNDIKTEQNKQILFGFFLFIDFNSFFFLLHVLIVFSFVKT